MQQTLKRSGLARATGTAALAPVRPAIALRSCFKTGQQQQQPASRVVVAQASAIDVDPLVLKGLDKSAQADMLKLPKGYHWYETMMILRPSMNDEDRDKELAKFEAFLGKEECINITALVRPATRMAYMMKKHLEGIYVLYTYAAKRQSARAVQQFLSKPDVGSEEYRMMENSSPSKLYHPAMVAISSNFKESSLVMPAQDET